MRQSNILCIFYSGLRSDYLSAFGGPCHTPAFDACLARAQTIAHASPLCDRPEILLPSLLTGRLPDNLGLYPSALSNAKETLVDLAQKMGYRVLARAWIEADPGHMLPPWTIREWQSTHMEQLIQMLQEDHVQPRLILDHNRAISWRMSRAVQDGHAATMEGIIREDQRLYQLLDNMRHNNLHRKTTLALIGIAADSDANARRFMNQDSASVPIIIVPPFGEKPPKTTPKKASLPDVAPTIAGLMGTAFSQKTDGVDLNHVETGSSTAFYTLSGPSDSQEDIQPIPDPDRHILQRAVFVFTAMRSASLFFSEFFDREEFEQILTCTGHNQPNWERANLLYGAGLFNEKQVEDDILACKPQLEQIKNRLFCCVNHDCTYIMPIIARLFPNSRFIFVSRDGRNQIRSRMSYQRIFSDQRLAMQRYPNWRDTPTPGQTHQSWAKLDEFQRCCLVWEAVSRSMFRDTTALGARGCHVHFEDVFDAKRGFPGMVQIREFVADEFEIPTSSGWLNSILTKKVHADFHHFPAFDDWHPDQKAFFEEHAEKTMKQLGYTIKSSKP